MIDNIDNYVKETIHDGKSAYARQSDWQEEQNSSTMPTNFDNDVKEMIHDTKSAYARPDRQEEQNSTTMPTQTSMQGYFGQGSGIQWLFGYPSQYTQQQFPSTQTQVFRSQQNVQRSPTCYGCDHHSTL